MRSNKRLEFSKGCIILLCAVLLISGVISLKGNEQKISEQTSRNDLLDTSNFGLANGILISDIQFDQWNPVICSDGVEGAIIAWIDYRAGVEDIYAQRIDSTGQTHWAPNGTLICNANDEQTGLAIISDGAGGAIIAWCDYRSESRYDIYAQRINAAGVTLWDPNGTLVNSIALHKRNPALCLASDGGAIIAWRHETAASNRDIYAQRINATGGAEWSASGVSICTHPADLNFPYICTDGNGGAVITWEDFRGADQDIYAQRINSAGAIQWYTDGIVICNASQIQRKVKICSDNNSGAIVTWADFRDEKDIYAQRIDQDGTGLWERNGIAICNATGDQAAPILCDLGGGNYVISWEDARTSLKDIYAQKIDSDGNFQWALNGSAVCTAADLQQDVECCSDGMGGAIFTWRDRRENTHYDLYTQRIDSDGNPVWTVNGTALCASLTTNDLNIVSSKTGGAIICWDCESSIYAAGIGMPTSSGDIPGFELLVVLISVLGIIVVIEAWKKLEPVPR